MINYKPKIHKAVLHQLIEREIRERPEPEQARLLSVWELIRKQKGKV